MKAERAGQDLAPALRGERLLVVDDDPDVRVSLERALRCAGYAVTTAVHGADALDALARAPVDLIVLDVLMPMVDGFDACRRLRARGDATPILVLTARDAVDDRVAGLAAGADDYLVKPFAFAELLNEEVRALQADGVDMIQFDEPAFNVYMDEVRDWGIAALERAIGASLFDRLPGSRGVEVTPEGRVLLEHVAVITSRSRRRSGLRARPGPGRRWAP